MALRGRFVLGVFVLILSLGMLGAVALAAEETPKAASAAKVPLLTTQVRILKAIEELDLSTEQIKGILNTLKELDSRIKEHQKQAVRLLLKERDLLLNPEVDKAQIEDVERLLRINHEELSLSMQGARLELSKLLTAEQTRNLGRFDQERVKKQIQNQRDMTPEQRERLRERMEEAGPSFMQKGTPNMKGRQQQFRGQNQPGLFLGQLKMGILIDTLQKKLETAL